MDGNDEEKCAKSGRRVNHGRRCRLGPHAWRKHTLVRIEQCQREHTFNRTSSLRFDVP